MFKNISDIIIWSENYQELTKWYEKILGLKKIGEVNHPQDKAIGYKVGNLEIWIGFHDKVKGKNKDKYRIMVNLSVDSVSASYQYLLQKRSKIYSQTFQSSHF